jgi:hypothetical protein
LTTPVFVVSRNQFPFDPRKTPTLAPGEFVVVIVIALTDDVDVPLALETVSVAVPDTVYVWVVFLREAVVVLNHCPPPKLQFHAVGVPLDVSLNITARGATPDVTFVANDATGAPADVTVIVVPDDNEVPLALETVSLAEGVPDTLYVWVVFLRDDVLVLNHDPSPKLQFHAVGVPLDVSLNITARGATPDVTFVANDATGPAPVIVIVVAEEVVVPLALVTVSVADRVPAATYEWVVFLRDEVVVLNHCPSPKLQFHTVGVPEDVSLNITARGAAPDVTFVANDATGPVGPEDV